MGMSPNSYRIIINNQKFKREHATAEDAGEIKIIWPSVFQDILKLLKSMGVGEK